MKKHLQLFVLVFVALFLAACSTNQVPTELEPLAMGSCPGADDDAKDLVAAENGNCSVTDFDVKGDFQENESFDRLRLTPKPNPLILKTDEQFEAFINNPNDQFEVVVTEVHGNEVRRILITQPGHPGFGTVDVSFAPESKFTVPVPECRGQTATIFAGDSMNGTRISSPSGGSNDVIVGSNGPDDIDSRGGDDIVCGRDGDDNIRAGRGNDTVDGGKGNDTINGGMGDDRLLGRQGDDTINGGEGDDRIDGNQGDDILNGDEGDDRIRGGNGDDIIDGGEGNDRLEGGNGDDTLTGGGNDQNVFTVGKDNDTVKDFDVNGGNETSFDTLKFEFGGMNFALSTTHEFLDFVELIEMDTRGDTDAIVDGHDLILAFDRDGASGPFVDSVRLEGVVGQDGLTAAALFARGADTN